MNEFKQPSFTLWKYSHDFTGMPEKLVGKGKIAHDK